MRKQVSTRRETTHGQAGEESTRPGKRAARRTREPGGRAKERGSHQGGAGGLPRSTDSPVLLPSTLSSASPDIPVFVPADLPGPPEHVTPTDYKGTPLARIGRYPDGKVIPHQYSPAVAEKVRMWAAGGYNKNDVAVMLNIRPGLVEQHYGMELRHGADKIGMDMTAHIIKRAKKSDPILKFYAKARMGWKDGESQSGVQDSPLAIHIHA